MLACGTCLSRWVAKAHSLVLLYGITVESKPSALPLTTICSALNRHAVRYWRFLCDALAVHHPLHDTDHSDLCAVRGVLDDLLRQAGQAVDAHRVPELLL